jgi:hypothetical protein
MSNPIQFLSKQLTTNEQDREKANLILPTKIRCHLSLDDGSLEFGNAYNSSQPFDRWEEIYQEKIIRTCLSRVNGQAVLGVFDKKVIYLVSETEEQGKNYKQFDLDYLLYNSFDQPLRNGKPLDEALQALHDKMLDFVPEYVEFLNNNIV